jgi:hypothetical protein
MVPIESIGPLKLRWRWRGGQYMRVPLLIDTRDRFLLMNGQEIRNDLHNKPMRDYEEVSKHADGQQKRLKNVI